MKSIQTHQNVFHFPATGITVSENATLLSIDDATFPLKHNLCLYLTKPDVRSEGVLKPEAQNSNAPDNLAAQFYGTVLHDEGKFRMWYYACHFGENPDWEPELARQLANYKDEVFIGPLCYAESEDGLNWTKPNLGQLRFKGTCANNAFNLPHSIVSCATVVKDETDADPMRRYKMVYQFFHGASDPPLEGFSGFTTCAMAVSPDGIEWTVLATPYPHDFVEHASFYQHDGKYIVNSHQHSDQVLGEGGTPRGRQGFARFAYDYANWLPGSVESFTLPEPTDPTQRGIKTAYDQVHLGVGAVSFGTVCVGLYGLWHSADFDDEFEEISCDFGLLISNDGLSFREPVKGHVYLSQYDSPAPELPGYNYNTVLCQANGILNVGDETRIYHGRWRNANFLETGSEHQHYYGEVALATLPRDRWGALGLFPDQHVGSVWTAPITLPTEPSQLLCNATGTSGLTIEIGDEQCRPIAAHSGQNAGTVPGTDGLDCPVVWPAGSMEGLAGQTVRFKIHLATEASISPRLYALGLKTG
jgi:hypothetical protein